MSNNGLYAPQPFNKTGQCTTYRRVDAPPPSAASPSPMPPPRANPMSSPPWADLAFVEHLNDVKSTMPAELQKEMGSVFDRMEERWPPGRNPPPVATKPKTFVVDDVNHGPMKAQVQRFTSTQQDTQEHKFETTAKSRESTAVGYNTTNPVQMLGNMDQRLRNTVPAYFMTKSFTENHTPSNTPNNSAAQLVNPIPVAKQRSAAMDLAAASLQDATSDFFSFLENYGGAPAAAAPGEVPRLVQLYDDLLNNELAAWTQLSNKIGGDCTQLAKMTTEAFGRQREFMFTSAGQAKPDDKTFMSMLQPTSEYIVKLNELRDSNRKSAQFDHLCAIADSIAVLGWVAERLPIPHVEAHIDASKFYTNKVLKAYKEKDPTHVQWVATWLEMLTALKAYVKANHTTGLVWNSSPGAKAPANASGPKPPAPLGSAPPPPPGGPPPPPPPPPPMDLTKGDAKEDAPAKLFAELNQGLDITKSLKKVTSEMQTHKNPELRASSMVAAKDAKPALAPKPGKAAAVAVQHEPVVKFEDGKKWIVEYQRQNKECVINIENPKQVVYIYKCDNSVIIVKGKANSICLDSCKKTSVVFDGLVSQIEIINCQSAQVQTMGALPTIAIQKTDGCQVYLGTDSINAEIVSSKSSEMNILVPDANGEFTEMAVPEQYKTIVTNGKLQTTVVDV